jgi:hypothetical protein
MGVLLAIAVLLSAGLAGLVFARRFGVDVDRHVGECIQQGFSTTLRTRYVWTAAPCLRR